MRHWKKLLITTVLLVGIAGFVIPTVWFKPYSAEHLYARIFLGFTLESPMVLSQLQFLPPWLDFHSSRLDKRSPAAQEKRAQTLERELRILRSFDRGAIRDTLSYDILEWFMADADEADAFRLHSYPLNQVDGEQGHLPSFMLATHPLNTRRDARNYVRRLQQFDRYFAEVLEDLRIREEYGVIPPRFVVQHVLNEMRAFIAPPPQEHELYNRLRDRTDAMSGVDEDQQEELLRAAEDALAAHVYPAYQHLIEYAEHLANIASTDDGVWKLPDGDAYYRQRLRHHTTTALTPDEIHEMGVQQVERIQSELRSILAAEGYDVENLARTLAALHVDPRFQWPDSDEGREEILAEYQRIIDDIEENIEYLFATRPASEIQVEAVPQFRQETFPLASYRAPALDGSRPGVFYANLRDVGDHAKFRMRTLAYHEGVPGHHLQMALAQELQDIPFFRRVIPFTAYWEGWALYAEQLAAEHGYHDDPYDHIGYLVDQLWRAARLVVDTGIHHQRWTREKAIQYMMTETGKSEGDVAVEVERYIVMPGQATSYMVGQLMILDMRERARQRLGSRFDVRAFHDVVLMNGAMPLTLLDQVVDNWIEAQAGLS